MKKLDECIKVFSLIYTNTFNKLDFDRLGTSVLKENINYENSISLYDLIFKFNKLYLSFKKEYEALDKLELGNYIEIFKFVKDDRNNYRHLPIHIKEPVISDTDYTNLYLVEYNNENRSFITNDINPRDEEYYNYEVNLDMDKVKKYLDLFEKYSILLYLYYHFKKGIIFEDGRYTIYTCIKSDNDNFLDELKEFEILLHASYFNKPNDSIDLSINLGENFGINTPNCEIKLGDDNIFANEEICLKILKNVFISERYLNTYWDRVDHEKKVSIKSLIKVADSIKSHWKKSQNMV